MIYDDTGALDLELLGDMLLVQALLGADLGVAKGFMTQELCAPSVVLMEQLFAVLAPLKRSGENEIIML